MTVPTSEQQKWNPAQLDNGTLTVVPIPHQHVWDLLRQMRGHLSDEGLISMREYAWIASEAPGVNGAGSPAPRRLENYDEMKARLETIDELEAALLRELAQHQWQDIATAPKDGTPIRAFAAELIDEDFNPSGSVEAHWQDDEEWVGAVWESEHDIWQAIVIYPTHWMPLPSPPVAEPAKDGGQ